MWDGCGNGESVTACVEGCGVEKGDVFMVGLFLECTCGEERSVCPLKCVFMVF